MSIAILVSVHDGIVLAADSASTLLVSAPGGPQGVANVYDNANKIFNVHKGSPIGCVVFGTGSIGNASVSTLVKDLRQELTAGKRGFDSDRYSMEDIAKTIASFFGEECEKIVDPVARENTNIGILLGGYSSDERLGEGWLVEIRKGNPDQPRKLREKDQVGISWGGQAEVVQRIILGFSPAVFQVIAEATQPANVDATRDQLASQLGPLMTARLQAQVVFAPMPIQDAIDLARFLVHSATMYSRFSPGAQVVGGPIEVAAITKHEGFKWISRKHYYDATFNREPIHVVVDK